MGALFTLNYKIAATEPMTYDLRGGRRTNNCNRLQKQSKKETEADRDVESRKIKTIEKEMGF